jgi:transposase-like protein
VIVDREQALQPLDLLGGEQVDAGAQRSPWTRPKTVLTAATGPVEIEVPRGRESNFEPVIVKNRQPAVRRRRSRVVALGSWPRSRHA